jgi:chromosome segregation ATPase
MSGATTRIGFMERKLTLHDVVERLDQLTNVVNEGFAVSWRRMDAMERKIESLDKRVESLEYSFGGMRANLHALNLKVDSLAHNLHATRQKIDRIELMVHNTQKDVEGIHGEMRGVHKVLDRFNIRLTQVEDRAGPTPKMA